MLPHLHRKCPHPSRPDNYLPLRRADNSSVNSAVVCSLRYSPSSGRPTAPATPSLEGFHCKSDSSPRRSVAPSLTHKTPVPLTYAANTSSRTPYESICCKHQSHLSYKPSIWLLPTKPPLSWFLQKEAFTQPPLCCSVMPPSRVAVLVPAGDHSARQQHRPAAARRPASTSISPCARVVFQPQLLRQFRKYE